MSLRTGQGLTSLLTTCWVVVIWQQVRTLCDYIATWGMFFVFLIQLRLQAIATWGMLFVCDTAMNEGLVLLHIHLRKVFCLFTAVCEGFVLLEWSEECFLFVEQLRVRALYDYRAQRPDELSFPKNAIVTDVQKQDGGWWVFPTCSQYVLSEFFKNPVMKFKFY